MKTASSLAIFLLFFGLAALEALRTHNWPVVAFWLLIAVSFAWLSRRGSASPSA